MRNAVTAAIKIASPDSRKYNNRIRLMKICSAIGKIKQKQKQKRKN